MALIEVNLILHVVSYLSIAVINAIIDSLSADVAPEGNLKTLYKILYHCDHYLLVTVAFDCHSRFL